MSETVRVSKESLALTVNGLVRDIAAKPYALLSDILRDELGFTGVKRGCDYGGCGACTVEIDGKVVYSCMYPASHAVGKNILTVEGLSVEGSHSFEKLSDLQKSFLEHGGLQCGYCTPGIMISAKCLLEKNPNPNLAEIQEALAGNICRCTGYGRIIESIVLAAKSRNEKPT